MWKLATPVALLMAGLLASCGSPCTTMANCMPSYAASPPPEAAATLIFRLDKARSPQVINQVLHAGDGPEFGNRRYIGVLGAAGRPPELDPWRVGPVTIPAGERLFLRVIGRGADESNDTYSWYQCEQTFSFIPEPHRTYDLQQLYAERTCLLRLTDTGTGLSPETLEIVRAETEAGR
jgi:hypothetical protein